MSKAMNKAIQVYRNQGAKGVAKKSRSTFKYRAGNVSRRLSVRRESLEEKQLREEFGALSNSIFQITAEDIATSKKVTTGPKPERIRTATWFVPYYDHFGFNGI